MSLVATPSSPYYFSRSPCTRCERGTSACVHRTPCHNRRKRRSDPLARSFPVACASRPRHGTERCERDRMVILAWIVGEAAWGGWNNYKGVLPIGQAGGGLRSVGFVRVREGPKMLLTFTGIS